GKRKTLSTTCFYFPTTLLINLLSNAVKFTPEGSSITLEATAEEEPDYISFTVKDTGIGIAPEDIGKIFQPFVQVDNTLNRKYTGTGLGLSLVKKIAEMHGGSVSVESEVNKGSCFKIQLPFKQGKAELEPSVDSLPNTLELKQRWNYVERPKILIAEDNQENVDTIWDYLENQGYELLLATDGQEALDIANTKHPDIILMDIQMPKMDGLTATKHIRANPELSNVPVIVLTALAMVGDREKCLEAGVNEYLTKPVKLKHLAETIEYFLTVACKKDRLSNGIHGLQGEK
ncbi:ATP-binding protein, partial [Tumidithrix elongata RA019]|nr:ATP-binding protein [Tumidithrix elongata RA019]